MQKIFSYIKPHTFFLACALVFGTVYSLFTPALVSPDEYEHFLRANQVSEGQFLPLKKDKRLGGEIPEGFYRFMIPYRFVAHNLKHTTSFAEMRQTLNFKWNDSIKRFVDFPNTSYYSPLCYAPQAIAIAAVKSLSDSSGLVYYLARLFTFLIWVLIVYCAIKITPVHPWLFAFLALLPMQIFVSNSLSADVLTDGIAFLFIAVILKFAFDDEKISPRRMLILFLLAVLLSQLKLVYTALVPLVLIIPRSKFNNTSVRYAVTLSIIFLAFFLAWIWSIVVMKHYTPFTEYNEQYREHCCVSRFANYYEQKEYILSHPLYFPRLLWKSVFSHPQLYLTGYIGILGAHDLPLPGWVVVTSYLLIILIASAGVSFIRLKAKILLILCAFSSFVLLLLSQHLTWDTVGEGVVGLIQGRYLIPLMPLILLCFSGIIRIGPRLLQTSGMILVVALNAYGARMVYKRYHVDSSIRMVEYSCDAEAISNGKFLTSSPQVQLESGSNQSSTVSRRGKHSVMLTPASPYGMGYRFRGLHYGDYIEVNGWERGSGGKYVVHIKNKNCEEQFIPGAKALYSENGWTRSFHTVVMMDKCVPADSTEVIVFLWNTGKDTVYYDDLQVTIKKFNSDYLDKNRKLLE
jgi:uncharacterized membrane protein